MSNNKHNSNSKNPTANTDGRPNPNDVIAAARAKQEQPTAKADANAKQPIDVSASLKASDDKSTTKSEPVAKGGRKRKTKEEWIAILAKKDKENLTAEQVAEQYGTSVGNVYAWSSKLKAEEALGDTAKLTPSSAASDIQKLKDGVQAQLAAFDAKVEEAKQLVANAATERKKIEDSEKEYQTIIDMLTKKA